MENVKQYLEALGSDPRAAELIKEIGRPTNEREFAAIHAPIAEKLGFAVTEEELLQFIEGQRNEVAGSSDEAAEEVREMSADELDKVAGGKQWPECKDTFTNAEDCGWNDGCDLIHNDYNRYVCLVLNTGGVASW